MVQIQQSMLHHSLNIRKADIKFGHSPKNPRHILIQIHNRRAPSWAPIPLGPTIIHPIQILFNEPKNQPLDPNDPLLTGHQPMPQNPHRQVPNLTLTIRLPQLPIILVYNKIRLVQLILLIFPSKISPKLIQKLVYFFYRKSCLVERIAFFYLQIIYVNFLGPLEVGVVGGVQWLFGFWTCDVQEVLHPLLSLGRV